MENTVKINYTCPYDTINGIIGYVVARESRRYPGTYIISKAAYNRACGKLPIGGVLPDFDKPVAYRNANGFCYDGCFGWYEV